jgi:hypothetical protein
MSDFNYVNCPYREEGALGDFIKDNFGCRKTDGPNADGRGYGCDPCDFSGSDYRECLRFSDSDLEK